MRKSEKKPYLYIFLHVPKCAGTTLTYHLEQNFPKEELMPLYAFKFYNHNSEQFEHITSRKNINVHLCNLAEGKKNRIRFVYGHLAFYGIHNYFKRQSRYVTFLRDPVERTISQYYHYRRQHERHLPIPPWRKRLPPGLSFKEWFDTNDQSHNHMTYSFLKKLGLPIKRLHSPEDLAIVKEVLSQFFFVGITERARNDLLYLYDLFGIRKFYADQNITSRRDADPDPVIRGEILSKNNLDQALYDFAFILNHKQRAERLDYRIRIGKTWIKRVFSPLFSLRKNIQEFHKDYLRYDERRQTDPR